MTRKRGRRHIILGGAMIILLLVYFAQRFVPNADFEDVLSQNNTAVLFEFPVEPDPNVIKILEKNFPLAWNESVKNWGLSRAALAITMDRNRGTASNYDSLLLFQTESVEKTFQLLSQSAAGNLQKYEVNGRTAFSGTTSHFAFLNNILVFAPSRDALDRFMQAQSRFKKFRTVRASQDSYRMTVQPRIIPDIVLAKAGFIDMLKGSLFIPAYELISISAHKIEDGSWYGIARAESSTLEANDSRAPFQARLMRYIPIGATYVIGSTDLAVLIKTASQQTRSLIGKAVDEYLQGIAPDILFTKLLGSESILATFNDKLLIISEHSDDGFIPSLERAFVASAKQLVGKPQPVTLPDGATAFELFPDPSQIVKRAHRFNTVEIFEIAVGAKFSVYYANVGNKFMASNDKDLLQRSLSLALHGGRSLYASALYSAALQPILKNPDLYGIVDLPNIQFGFSKQILRKKAEIAFRYVYKANRP